MRNKEFQKLLKKHKSKSNSGFTLTELLVGLFMSIFVIGALGFGLMQILGVTQKGNSETLVRNDSSRALDFISDEMRRASGIEVNTSVSYLATADNASTTDINEEVAPSFTPLQDSSGNDISPALVLKIPNVDQRIIYTVAPAQDPWKGPLVIYRWGPNLDANGNYTDSDTPASWRSQALVDGISDETVTANGCDMDSDSNDDTYEGFLACVIDDDGDALTENAADTNGDGKITFADDSNDRNGDGVLNFGDTLTDGADAGTDITLADSAWDKNGDGEINNEDAADVDGLAITAQLYFTGETKDASGVNASTYSADTKTVTRARSTPDNNSDDFGSYITSYRTLEPSFGCNQNEEWRMRTDFGDSFSNPSNLDKWDFKDDAQPQPIAINSNTLIVSSIPRGINPLETGYVSSDSTCLNRRDNNGHGGTTATTFDGNKSLGASDDWHTNDNNDIVAISHAINFNDPRTFNGDPYGCSGASCHSTDGKVYTQKDGAAAELNPYVRMLKQGSPVPALEGYDMNKDGDTTDPGEQISLKEFLYSKGLAIPVDGGDPYNAATTFKLPTSSELDTYLASSSLETQLTSEGLTNAEKQEFKDKFKALGEDQRIIAFEIGKSDVSDPDADPGVDFQDNIFVLQSEAFEQKYKTYTDSNDPSYDSDNVPTYSALDL